MANSVSKGFGIAMKTLLILPFILDWRVCVGLAHISKETTKDTVYHPDSDSSQVCQMNLQWV